MSRSKIIITGAAGFIGSALALRLLQRGDEVIGADNLDPYYEVSLKKARLTRTRAFADFRDVQIDIANAAAVADLFAREKPAVVVNLAAQVGAQYSLKNPGAYGDTNLVGFLNVLEACRHNNVGHLVYASSSSVYGANRKLPFSVQHNVDHPLSLYAASKKANELMAHSYSHLYHLPATGLRFFSTYGPWGRPDMALFLFTRKILEGQPIDVFNEGRDRRDFIFIDDMVEAVVQAIDHPASPNAQWRGEAPDPATSTAPHRIFNIGSNEQTEIARCIEILETCLGRTAEKNLLPPRPVDMLDTFADAEGHAKHCNKRAKTSIEAGIRRFVDWYKTYYGISS